MISAFGIISFFAAVLSVGALVFVYRILRRRTAVDEAFATLDNFSRAQLEIIFEAAENLPDADEICEMCEVLSGYETRLLHKSLSRLRKSVPENAALSDAVSKTEIAAGSLNEKIDGFNAFSRTFPARFILPVLGITREKNV